MKIRNLTLIILVLIICISCNNDDDNNPKPENINTEQGLVFDIKDNTNTAVEGATIGICFTISEALNNTFIESKISDSDGKAVFTTIAAGNYYYKVTSTFGEKTQQFTYDGSNQTLIVHVN